MDKFRSSQDSVSSPARSAIGVIPADGQELAIIPKAIFIGSGGDLRIRCVDDEVDILFRNVQSGTILPLRVNEILDSDTTASGLVLLA